MSLYEHYKESYVIGVFDYFDILERLHACPDPFIAAGYKVKLQNRAAENRDIANLINKGNGKTNHHQPTTVGDMAQCQTHSLGDHNPQGY